MVITAKETCPACGYENGAEAATCGLCGALVGPQDRGALTDRSAADHGLPVAAHSRSPLRDEVHLPRCGSGEEPTQLEPPLTPWLYLGAGLLLAQAFQLTHITNFMGWFLSALPHEMGHSLFSCYVGMPAYPAISLKGHAAAIHQPQVLVLALLIWGGLGWATWAMRRHRVARVILGLAVLSYPMLAFMHTPRELMHLLGGHLGELAFATVCFCRTLSGGFTESRAERGLYAVLGWHLLCQNLWLCWGLINDAGARAHYRGNGSFGLTNDYIRVAEDVLSWSLPGVATLMLIVALFVLPLSIVVWRLRPE